MGDIHQGEDDPSILLLEAVLAGFDSAWFSKAHGIPNIADFVNRGSTLSDDFRRRLLWELILIDQEFRWRAGSSGRLIEDRLGTNPLWKDYQRAFAELLELTLVPAHIIAEEYRVRQLWGDKPNHDAFLAQYATWMPALLGRLQDVDHELAADRVTLETGLARQVKFTCLHPCRFAFDDFLLQKHLGTGGLGKVYRAWQHSEQRIVAVKTVRKHHRHNPAALASLVRELECMAELQHPGIVKVYGLGSYPGGGYFLVLDYIDGPDFQTILERRPLPVLEAVRVALAAADAVACAHRQGVLHCDLKPGNVLQTSTGQTLVTDFGFGQVIRDPAKQSLQMLGGTLGYAAPEILWPGIAQVSTASDVFGIGALLYALLTGAAPRQLRDHSSFNSSMAIQESNLISLGQMAEVRREIPASLEGIAMKCLATKPSDRYQTATEVAVSLSEWLSVNAAEQ